MEFFLNKLTDSIIILNDHGKIRFANKAFISSIYKDNEEIDLDEVNEIVKLNDDKVTVYHMNEISKEGVYEVSNINFGEENLKVLIIKWKKTIKEEIHVEMLLNLLNQILAHNLLLYLRISLRFQIIPKIGNSLINILRDIFRRTQLFTNSFDQIPLRRDDLHICCIKLRHIVI